MDRKKDLAVLVELLTELRTYVGDFQTTRFLGPEGCDNFVLLTEQVNRLCDSYEIPKFIRCKVQTLNSRGAAIEPLKIIIKDPATGIERATALAEASGWRLDKNRKPCPKLVSMIDFFDQYIKSVSAEAMKPSETNEVINQSKHSDANVREESKVKPGNQGKPGPKPRALNKLEKRVYELWMTRRFLRSELDAKLREDFRHDYTKEELEKEIPYGTVKRIMGNIRAMAKRQGISTDELHARRSKKTTKPTK
jgi:hypothetical protein